ncbi:MAG: hypothetical protein U0172_05310 [Nitrospiraceae bacterium]
MRATLRDAMERAEAAIRRAYGDVHSHPRINACISEACYEAFGGERGSIAKIYGHRMLLSPRGLNWHFIAHEWSHDEIHTRLSLRARWRLPQWFDEGVAVAISEAPEHSEAHWQWLVASNIPRPTTEELHTLVSLQQWFDALHRYSGSKSAERNAEREPEYRPVYSAAGHELRGWLATVGPAGLMALIERMNGGEDFESAYRVGSTAIDASTMQGA